MRLANAGTETALNGAQKSYQNKDLFPRSSFSESLRSAKAQLVVGTVGLRVVRAVQLLKRGTQSAPQLEPCC